MTTPAFSPAPRRRRRARRAARRPRPRRRHHDAGDHPRDRAGPRRDRRAGKRRGRRPRAAPARPSARWTRRSSSSAASRTARASGRARSSQKSRDRRGAILAAERVALNFLGRLSGVATLTARYCDAIAGTSAQDLRHAQDHARSARLREIRRALRRRLQSPLRPRRRHAHQGQPHRRRRRRHSRACAPRKASPAISSRSRSKSIRSTNCARCSAEGADAVLLDNMTLDESARSAVALVERPHDLRSLGRRHARETSTEIAETGVDSRLGWRADAFGARVFDLGLDIEIGDMKGLVSDLMRRQAPIASFAAERIAIRRRQRQRTHELR